MRYFLDISYNGTAYHGWQEQTNAISIQEMINNALSLILRRETKCVASGRTDTGVHALQQVVHFDVDKALNKAEFQYQLNAVLPDDIAVNTTREVQEGAHARFDAMKRSYRYFMHSRKNPFKKETSYFFPHHIDLGQIAQGCKIFEQWTDFESFSKVKTDVTNFNCQIFEARWEEVENGYIFCVSANRFLRGMVRAMVGTLLDIGTGKRTPDQLKLVLEQRDRKAAGRSVPPQGLFLSAVEYPEHIYI